MRRQLHVHEAEFPHKKFLTSYFIDGQVLFRIFFFLYYIWQFVSELIEYICINTQKSNTLRFKRNYIMHCQAAKKSDEHGMLFPSSLKIDRTLNSRLIWVQWKFTTPNQYIASPSFCLLRFFFFWPLRYSSYCSKETNSFKW